MECRPACGACCIAPSINQPLPGMPNGKPAGQVCIHLDKHYRCDLFGQPERPKLCQAFLAEAAVCGETREQALSLITVLELATESH